MEDIPPEACELNCDDDDDDILDPDKMGRFIACKLLEMRNGTGRNAHLYIFSDYDYGAASFPKEYKLSEDQKTTILLGKNDNETVEISFIIEPYKHNDSTTFERLKTVIFEELLPLFLECFSIELYGSTSEVVNTETSYAANVAVVSKF